MIIVTGAAGFIGSCLVAHLNAKGIRNIGLVDDFNSEAKQKNIADKSFLNVIDRNEFLQWFDIQNDSIELVIHLGARTDTTEFNYDVLHKLNVEYTQEIWKRCARYNVPLIYASSAATYGDGTLGYSDAHEMIPNYKPLNPYGRSKQEVDEWILLQTETPPRWYGLKFFNVYGPNEYHKRRMASVVFHAFNQIQETGKAKLFRSHRDDFEDGKQLRDFIYVKDVCNVIEWLMENENAPSGIYNLGSGEARTFVDLISAVFHTLNKAPNIEWIDIPLDIRDKYQYYTEADMSKLKSIGFTNAFYSLEEGVKDYVANYLVANKYY
jgi:ADP-L-glycero-D-manno-heptose 6-epimerase